MIGTSMHIIVGLGNPGAAYEGTRHNIGFETVDCLSRAHQIPVTKTKQSARVGEGYIARTRVLLAKPQTYMNLSGVSVAALLRYYQIPPTAMIVVYDDVNLPAGAIRVREKGSAGGHNGIKDLLARLGTDVFPRVRVGVGQKPPGWDLADYVLSRFHPTETETMSAAIAQAAEAVSVILAEGTAAAMNRFNGQRKEET